MAVNVGINLSNPTKINVQVGPVQAGLQIGSTATPAGNSGAANSQNPLSATPGDQTVNVPGSGNGYTGGGNGAAQAPQGNQPPWAGGNANEQSQGGQSPHGPPYEQIGNPRPDPALGSLNKDNFGALVGANGNPLTGQTPALPEQAQTGATPSPGPDPGGALPDRGGAAQGGLPEGRSVGVPGPAGPLPNRGLGIGAQIHTGLGQGVSANAGINLNLGANPAVQVGVQVNLGAAQLQAARSRAEAMNRLGRIIIGHR
jgi:hypothetical protein